MSGAISSYAGSETMAAADLAGARARSALLAFEVTSAAPPPPAMRGLDAVHLGWRPAGVADEPRHRLFAEVAIGLDRTKAMLRRLGPELAQTGLLTALEARASGTYDHARRVAESAAALAKMMCLSESEVREVRRAALFHDIGKIAIPSHMLDRFGPLSDDEIAVLRLHVTIGAEILSDIPALAAAAAVVMATHERYDGRGYPLGLAGSDIPLGARIIAVADAHDAMTGRRPYGTPLSRTDANSELRRCSGAHFDPDVVDAWMEMVDALAYWSA